SLFSFTLRHRSGRSKFCVSFLVKKGELVCRFLLSEFGFGCRYLRFCLSYASLGVHFRLFYLQMILSPLLLQNRDLITRWICLRLRHRQSRASLILPCSDLLVIQYRYRVSGFYRVTFSHAYLLDPSSYLRRDRRIIALNSPAESNYVLGSGSMVKKEIPDQNGYDEDNQNAQ